MSCNHTGKRMDPRYEMIGMVFIGNVKCVRIVGSIAAASAYIHLSAAAAAYIPLSAAVAVAVVTVGVGVVVGMSVVVV